MDAAELQACRQELLKLGELTQEEAMAKADALRATIGRRYNVTPYLSGSMATGLNLPGKYDYDYGVRVKSQPKFERLVQRLESSGLKASPFNKPGTDYHVFSGKMGDDDVDLALMYGDKGLQAREAVRGAAKKVEEMGPEAKEKLLKTKGRLKMLSGLPLVGGAAKKFLEKPWKRKIDQQLGMVRFGKDKLPSLEKEGRALAPWEQQRLTRSNVFGHRTNDLTPLIESGEILSAATAAKRGLLKSVETSNPFSRERSQAKGPTELRSEVFITKGLLPPDATYGRYGVLFEKQKKEKSRYLNLIPEEHTTSGVKGRSMTFVVPDKELKRWEGDYPEHRIIGESQVPPQKHLPEKSIGALASRILRVPKLFQRTEKVSLS